MEMSVYYEWQVEVTNTLDTEEMEAGEVIEGDRRENYKLAADDAKKGTGDSGTHYEIVLIRNVYSKDDPDDLIDRQWAYIGNNTTSFQTNSTAALRFPSDSMQKWRKPNPHKEQRKTMSDEQKHTPMPSKEGLHILFAFANDADKGMEIIESLILERDRLREANREMRKALDLIASCESKHPSDVVAIAQRLIAKHSATSSDKEG